MKYLRWMASAKLVLRKRFYLGLAACSSIVFIIIFSMLDGLILFNPLTFYYPIPQDAVPNFLLSIITAPLVGIIISMNAFIYNRSKKIATKSLISSSTLGTVSSMCASCGSIGFYLSSTFGTAGVAASTFFSNYQIPLRIVAIIILLWAYFSAHRNIMRSCSINIKKS